MFILIAAMLAALVGGWIVFPLFVMKPGVSSRERAVITEDIEREVDELRKGIEAGDGNSSRA